MMITETETVTLTLHHNIFTYLDYVFSATFILLDFNPYLLSLMVIVLRNGHSDLSSSLVENAVCISLEKGMYTTILSSAVGI